MPRLIDFEDGFETDQAPTDEVLEDSVVGPASATDNSIARFDGTTGKLIQNTTGASIDDSGNATLNNAILSATTATTVPYLNASKQLTSSAVTPTELGYVSGVTSAIQTQIAAKQASLPLTTKGDLLVHTGSAYARMPVGTDGQVLVAASGQTNGLQYQTVATINQYVQAVDTQTSGTAGGTATSGSWFTRVLNSLVIDGTGGASLASNAVTLPAGTYTFRGMSVAYRTNAHQVRLYNVTDTAVIKYGYTGCSDADQDVNNPSVVSGQFTIASSKAIRLEQQVQTTRASDGQGFAHSFGNENIYSVLEFWKIA